MLFRKIRLSLVCSFVLGLLFLLATHPGNASAKALAPMTAPAACQRIVNANYSQVCVTPTVTTSPQSQCPGNNQYTPTTDDYGNPIDVTLTDQGNTCVTVSYNLSHSFDTCDIYFYIPLGSKATAVFNYTYHDASGTYTGTINEDTSIAGWKDLFNSASATSLTFNDHDTPGNKNLSWGTSVKYSLKIFCA